MAVVKRTAAEAAAKWQRNAAAGANDYSQHATAAAGRMASNAAAAKPAWQQGVSGPGAADRFSAHVGGSAQKYAAKIQSVGSARFSQGVGVSGDHFASSLAPVLARISAVQLPARGPRGSPGNNARVTAITDALRAMRLGTAAGVR